MRVHELAKELGVNTKVIMDLLASMKVQAKSHSSTLDEATVERVRRRVKGHVEAKPAEPGRVATPPSGERILGMRKIVPPPPPPEPPAPDSTTVDTPAIGAAGKTGRGGTARQGQTGPTRDQSRPASGRPAG